MTRALVTPSAVLAGLLAATPALAHVGHGVTAGLAAGFLHPMLGADHLLAMVAVGLWAGMVGGRAMWVWPSAFVGVMVAGGLLGMGDVAMPVVEPGILASVIVLGLVVAMAIRAPVWLGAVIVGSFALFHGHAHGTEVPATAGGVEYLVGFAAATALLHATGIAISVCIGRIATSRVAVRTLGGLVAVAGIALAAG